MKQIKIGLNKALFIGIIFIIIIGVVLYIFINKANNKVISSELIEYYLNTASDLGFLDTNELETTKYQLINTYSEYLEIIDKVDSWKYSSLKYIKTSKKYDNNYLNNKKEKDIIEEWDENIAKSIYDGLSDTVKSIFEERTKKIKQELNSGKYNEKYFEDYSLLLVEDLIFAEVVHDVKLNDVCINDNDLNVNLTIKSGGCVAGGDAELFFITLLKKDVENIKRVNVKINSVNTSVPGVAYKPIIYLYPTEETKVNVVLQNFNALTCSYPKYNFGWNVIAKPNGDLQELNTNKKLYALYYESKNIHEFKVKNDGFVIKRGDTANFLEEKLKILGLTYREREEFIIYWLPKLEANKYNYIRFATIYEIDSNMPLEISPTPDTIIRVLMTFKGLDNPIQVQEQHLTTPKRTGFVAVEWGATEIK